MKSKFLLVLFVLGGFCLNSCDNEDDIKASDLPGEISAYMALNYPNAHIIEASLERGYYDVDIMDGAISRELIFNSDIKWISTETDISLMDVPEIITTALASSEYSIYRIDDIDFFETTSGNYYYVDLESGRMEVDVKITLDGELEVVKVSKD